MECTHCGSSKYIKNGVYKNSQRYRCKECNRYFSDKVRKFTYADKRKALDLYLSGMGIRAIARFFGCSHPLIIRQIRVFASSVRSDLHAVQDALQDNQVPEVIEMDEIYTRVNLVHLYNLWKRSGC